MCMCCVAGTLLLKDFQLGAFLGKSVKSHKADLLSQRSGGHSHTSQKFLPLSCGDSFSTLAVRDGSPQPFWVG